MTRIVSIGTSTPPRAHTQEEIFELARYSREGLRRIFENGAIDRRHLALEPKHELTSDPNWFSRHYEQWSVRLGAEAARVALAGAGVAGSQIDYLVAVSCTGYLCPGLSQHLARELGLSDRAKTANLVGQGCNAAVPALERASEFVAAHPGARVLCVAVEICSATYWIDESDLESVVGNALFADGASAAVLTDAGTASPGSPELRRFVSKADREHLGHMGFRAQDGRLRVLLSREVPKLVEPLAAAAVEELLSEAGLARSDVRHWIVHPGGRRILELLEERWQLEDELQSSWDVLASHGNMSSATLLFVLARELELKRPRAGDHGVLVAMGPGLSVEAALVTF